jgi:hypothetical protein
MSGVHHRFEGTRMKARALKRNAIAQQPLGLRLLVVPFDPDQGEQALADGPERLAGDVDTSLGDTLQESDHEPCKRQMR